MFLGRYCSNAAFCQRYRRYLCCTFCILTMTVVYAWCKQDMTQYSQMESAAHTCREDINMLFWKWKDTGVMLPCPGGVIVMVCAVNSSSKYRVSVSEVTWGLNGGTSCCKRVHTWRHISTVHQLSSWWQSARFPGRHHKAGKASCLSLGPKKNLSIIWEISCTFSRFWCLIEIISICRNMTVTGQDEKKNLYTHLLLIHIFPFNSCKKLVLHDFLGIVGPSS